MKKIFTFVALLACGIAAMAQGLNASPFQAELRDASGELITNTTVGFRYKISCIGAENAVIEREGTAQTNANGVVQIRLGVDGTATANNKVANFGEFPFDKVAHNFKIPMTMEIDPKGGTDYTISGTTQIGFAVPYAVCAKNAESAQSFGDVKLTTINSINDQTGALSYTICGKDKSEITSSGVSVPMYSTINIKIDCPTGRDSRGIYTVAVDDLSMGAFTYDVERVGENLFDKYVVKSGNILYDNYNKALYVPIVIDNENPEIKIYFSSDVY